MSKKEMEASHAPDGCLLSIQVSSSQPGMQRQTDRQSAGTVSSTRSSSGIVYPSSVPSLTLRPMCGRALSCGQSLYPKPWPNAWYNMDPYEMRATRPLRLNRSSYLVGGMSSWDISEYTAQHFQRLYRLFLYLKRRKKNQKSLQ